MSTVLRAMERVSNRYELCRLASRMTRRLHFMSTDTQAAIEDTFGLIAVGRGYVHATASAEGESPDLVEVQRI